MPGKSIGFVRAQTTISWGIGRFAFTPLLPMMEMDSEASIALGGWLAATHYIWYLSWV